MYKDVKLTYLHQLQEPVPIRYLGEILLLIIQSKDASKTPILTCKGKSWAMHLDCVFAVWGTIHADPAIRHNEIIALDSRLREGWKIAAKL